MCVFYVCRVCVVCVCRVSEETEHGTRRGPGSGVSSPGSAAFRSFQRFYGNKSEVVNAKTAVLLHNQIIKMTLIDSTQPLLEGERISHQEMADVAGLAKQLDAMRQSAEPDWSAEGDLKHETLRESFLEAVEHIATTKVDVPEATQERLFGLFHAACAEERSRLDDMQPEQLKAVDAVAHLTEGEAMREYVKMVETVDPTFLFADDSEAEQKQNSLLSSKSTNFEGRAEVGGSSSTLVPPDTTIFKCAKQMGDINKVVDEGGLTALHHAVDSEEPHSVKALLGAKADVNAQDGQGSTPLHYAALLGSVELATMLLDAGASTAILDEDSHDAAALASSEGHADLAERIKGWVD